MEAVMGILCYQGLILVDVYVRRVQRSERSFSFCSYPLVGDPVIFTMVSPGVA